MPSPAQPLGGQDWIELVESIEDYWPGTKTWSKADPLSDLSRPNEAGMLRAAVYALFGEGRQTAPSPSTLMGKVREIAGARGVRLPLAACEHPNTTHIRPSALRTPPGFGTGSPPPTTPARSTPIRSSTGFPTRSTSIRMTPGTPTGSQRPVPTGQGRPSPSTGSRTRPMPAEKLVPAPFPGSGSTMVAAENPGRRSWQIELDPRYADVIIARYES